MASKVLSKPQHPIVLHPWGCPCPTMIKGDFVPKDVKQFGHSSQDLNLEYKKDSMLLFSEQLILVVLVEKRMGK
jgi:hypothetical protein